jgi:predicted DsbA family dithiol-disulfide isomerase
MEATHQIAEEWPGDVRVEFLQFPLAMHPNAESAAIASLAAQRQGKFWEMHDLLFENQGALDDASVEGYAKQVGCDMARFKKDIADPALKKRVQSEAKLGGVLGANATPAFLVNGKVSVGWGSWMAFRAQVEQERSAADALIAKGTKLADVHAKRAKENLTKPEVFAAYKAGIIDPLAKAAGGKSGKK